MLFEKDADALVVPASTAKIMTAEIVFHEITLGHLKLDDEFRRLKVGHFMVCEVIQFDHS